MSDQKKTLGYCEMCMQNVEHTRVFSSAITWFLDLATLRILKLFRLGPYYCFQCEQKRYYLRPVRRSVPTFDSETSTVGFAPSWFGENRKTGRGNESDQSVGDQAAEPIGNFLKTEHSLVMQDRRASNFTQKFRDATVLKILSGKALMIDIRHELEVTESDLIRWMADLMNRKQLRIKELAEAVEQLQSQFPERHPLRLVPSEGERRHTDGGPIIDGQVSES